MKKEVRVSLSNSSAVKQTPNASMPPVLAEAMLARSSEDPNSRNWASFFTSVGKCRRLFFGCHPGGLSLQFRQGPSRLSRSTTFPRWGAHSPGAGDPVFVFWTAGRLRSAFVGARALGAGLYALRLPSQAVTAQDAELLSRPFGVDPSRKIILNRSPGAVGPASRPGRAALC
jgi:hypothetical protein